MVVNPFLTQCVNTDYGAEPGKPTAVQIALGIHMLEHILSRPSEQEADRLLRGIRSDEAARKIGVSTKGS